MLSISFGEITKNGLRFTIFCTIDIKYSLFFSNFAIEKTSKLCLTRNPQDTGHMINV